MRLVKALMLITLFTLNACQSEPQKEEGVLSQETLISSRTLVRESNVGVRVDLFTQVFGGFFERRAGNTQGSGVIFFEDDTYYYVLTNFHVVNPRDYDRASYQLSPAFDTDPIEAELYVFDDTKDLAVLRFQKGEISLKVMNLSTRLNDPLVPGEFLLAVGNPSAINSIVTYGEYLDLVSIRDVDFKVIMHSALIFPGNSGGALTDINGNLVGLNTWRFQSGQDLNLAIPLETIQTFLISHDLWP